MVKEANHREFEDEPDYDKNGYEDDFRDTRVTELRNGKRVIREAPTIQGKTTPIISVKVL